MKALLLFLFAGSLAAQVPGPISIHAPCVQTMNNVVGAYSGKHALVGFQLGFAAIDVTRADGNPKFKNGTWRAMLGGCSGRSDLVWDINDYWESVHTLTATNGTEKWVLAAHSPAGAGSASHPVPPGMGGLVTWKWNGSAYDVVGLVQPPLGLKVRELGTPVLAGDTGWVELTNGSWAPCDLNAQTCAWTATQPSPPAGEGRQSGVGGWDYNVGIDYSHPNVDGGPQWFWMSRADQPTPTRPPAPSATRTVTGGVPRTSTRTPTYSACPPFCPPTSTPTPNALTRTRTPTVARTSTATATASPTPASARFAVTVTWTKPDGTSGVGVPSCSVLSADSSSSSVYWFFSESNWEIQVEVQPSYCSVAGHVMVKIAGTTNVAVDVTITDRQTGFSKVYHSPQGQLFQTVIDTAYEVCQ